MSELEINLLSRFSLLRTWLPLIQDEQSVFVRQRADSKASNYKKQRAALAYYEELIRLAVAQKNQQTGIQSLFGDTLWDFNPNYPQAARNVKGFKLRMDWSKYPNVSPVVLMEMKAALFIYYLAPNTIKERSSARKRSLKANTVIAHFQNGMRFLNAMSAIDQQEFGKDYVLSAGRGVKDFDKLSYQEAAKSYSYSYSNNLKAFFKIIQSPYLAEHVFGGHLPNVDPDSLEWKYAKEIKKDNEYRQQSVSASSDVLPNLVFEKASYYASMLVVDFLAALGMPVIDVDTLTRRNDRGFKLSEKHSISHRLMQMYSLLRLKNKGYSHECVRAILGDMPEELSTLRGSKVVGTISSQTLRKLSEGRLNEELRVYLNQVNYSCCYLVAQYTGMRPSELANIVTEDALEQDGDYWVIKSQVVKNRDTYRKLFDDAWVAIPILRDAFAAAKVCAIYKQNPYLFSTVDTVPPSKSPMPLESLGLRYQLEKFFKYVLHEDELKNLVFTPYTLRHTLAYQLYRADVGLPFISHQLKHFSDMVGGYQNRGYSTVTLGYGDIGDIIELGGRTKGNNNQFRHLAEKEAVRLHYDPDGSYAGVNANAHKTRNQEIFKLFEDSGYSKDEVFEALVEQGIAVVNIGMGMCYGGRVEDFDDSLPCIGGLRCNPNRCHNSVITQAHAPKWREVYYKNKMLLSDPFYQDRLDQINEVMQEAKGVLEYLGVDLELDI